MNPFTKKTIAAAALASLVIGGAWAGKSDAPSSVLRGQIQVQGKDGSWTSTSAVVAGDVLKSSEDNTVLRLPGATVRLSAGATMRFKEADAKNPAMNLQVDGGRAYVKLDPEVKLALQTGEGQELETQSSEFVVDSKSGDFYIVNGTIKAKKTPKSATEPLQTWATDGKAEVKEEKDSDDKEGAAKVESDDDDLGTTGAAILGGAGLLAAGLSGFQGSSSSTGPGGSGGSFSGNLGPTLFLASP